MSGFHTRPGFFISHTQIILITIIIVNGHKKKPNPKNATDNHDIMEIQNPVFT